MKQKSLSENYYQSLLISLQHVRNRTIFFTLFCIYALLNVLATTDKNIYMLDAIKMPLLGIELPLIAFSIAIPLFLIALQFNLLYIMNSHKQLLLNAYYRNEEDVKSLPSGLFEGALLYSDSSFFYKVIRFFIYAIVFLLPLFTLYAFFTKFINYHNYIISIWHIILIVICGFLILGYINILHFEKKMNIIYINPIIATIMLFIMFIIMLLYQNIKNECLAIFRIYPEIKCLGIKINGEILINYDKELLGLLANLEDSNNTKLLLQNPLLDRTYRNFEFADFSNNIMIRTDFSHSYLIDSVLIETNLQGSKFVKAKLQGANLSWANLEGADLSWANLEGADLRWANLKGANLWGANLKGANLEKANLKGAILYETNLEGTYLENTNLQYTYLSKVKLQGAYLEKTNFKGANIDEIDNTPLSKKDAKRLIEIVKNTKYYLEKDLNNDIQNRIIKSINSAIDKEPLIWLKEQSIITGELTKKEIEKICKEFIIDNEKTKEAKKRLGCDKIK
jgi:uncharacterized protein YjbI with pentapeptide repeats